MRCQHCGCWNSDNQPIGPAEPVISQQIHPAEILRATQRPMADDITRSSIQYQRPGSGDYHNQGGFGR